MGLFVVVIAAFAVPFVLGLFPAVKLPTVVAEIIVGIILGPSVLGWVTVDLPIQLLSVLGLAMLFMLAGLEVDLEGLRGRRLALASGGLAVSLVLAATVAGLLAVTGAVDSPVLVAIILITSALGIVVAVLKDAGVADTEAGQLIIAGATLGDVSAVILLSVVFSTGGGGPGAAVALIVALVVTMVVLLSIAGRVAGLARVMGEFTRLADTTAQIRVRGVIALLIGFLALASALSVETLLGAFLAGLLLGWLDRGGERVRPVFRAKLDGIGFGFLIPVFFVTSGLQFDLGALLGDRSALLLVPLFVVALLVVRGVPALLYRGAIGTREVAAAALLQATTLPFVVAATALGSELGLVSPAVAAALVAAGLLSVLFFPLIALGLFHRPGDAVSPEPSPPCLLYTSDAADE